MDNLEQHKILLQQIHDTYIKKNHDYGDSFSRSFKKYGLVAAMVRMEDKWNRLDNMALGAEQKVADETIRDTLLDLAGYCVMTTMELDRQNDFEKQRAFEEQVRDEFLNISSKDTIPNIEKETTTERETIDTGKVMALHNAKWSQAKIADEMGCSQSRISQIIKGHK